MTLDDTKRLKDITNSMIGVMIALGLEKEAVIWMPVGPVINCERQDQSFVQIMSTSSRSSSAAAEEDLIADNPDFRRVCQAFRLEIEVGAGPRRFIPFDELDKLPEPIDERGSS